MSLRIRLSIIVSLLCLTGIVLGTAYLVGSAKQRVAEEIESTATLAYQLLDTLLADPEAAMTDQARAQLVQRLSQIEDARHLDISITGDGQSTEISPSQTLTPGAPTWFATRVRPDSLEYRLPLSSDSQQIVLIRANPADEIAEAWAESKNLIIVLALVLAVLNSILYVIIGQWFKPVKDIVSGLGEVEQGNFGKLNTKVSLPELQVITEKINSLAEVLKSAQEDNRKLAKKSLHIQEEERKNLAQELHDDMGQSISAIKAIAFSIHQRASDESTTSGAEKIEAISTHMHEHVRGMMSKLRPTTLDELGLIPALQHMVDEWNDHHSEKFCSIKITDRIETSDPDIKINLYRIVQEALTNVARHSNATEVRILLTHGTAFQLSIIDNGIGFNPEKISAGLGLLGIRERSQALGGQCKITTEPTKGVRIDITFAGE